MFRRHFDPRTIFSPDNWKYFCQNATFLTVQSDLSPDSRNIMLNIESSEDIRTFFQYLWLSFTGNPISTRTKTICKLTYFFVIPPLIWSFKRLAISWFLRGMKYYIFVARDTGRSQGLSFSIKYYLGRLVYIYIYVSIWKN